MLVLLFAFGAYELTRKPTAVLIDKSTGRRFEIASDAGSMPLKARLNSAARLATNIDIAGSGDLESRKRRAYGALLGTVAAAALALLYFRRSIKG
jgi:hypothetical protein